MLSFAVFAVIATIVSAHGGGWMGMGMNNMGMGTNNMGMGTNNMGMGTNNMGMNNMGMNNMGMNNMGQQNTGISQLFQLLAGTRNQNGNGGSGQMGGNMGGNMGGQNQQGVMGQVMYMLIQNLLQNRQGQQSGMNQQETEEMEKLMKQKMMVEMADMMMAYMKFKEQEEQFKTAMESLCFVVHATFEGYKRMGHQAWNQTTDESMEQLGKEVMKMTEEEKMNYAIDMMKTNEAKYAEVFLRFATWTCMTGESYMEAYVAMEKLNKGEGSCEPPK